MSDVTAFPLIERPTCEVQSWLRSIGMAEYFEMFKEAGYDDIKVMSELNNSDLDILGIQKAGTRKKFLFHARQLPQAKDKYTKSSKRQMPYRCTKCCQFKVRSLDGKAHQCDPALFGHSFAQCPTRNARQHREERKKRSMARMGSVNRPTPPAELVGLPMPQDHPLLMHHSPPEQPRDETERPMESRHSSGLVPLLPMKRPRVEQDDSSQLLSWDAFREQEMAKIRQQCGELLDVEKIPEYHLAIVQRYRDLQAKHRKWKEQRIKGDELLAQEMTVPVASLPMPPHDDEHSHSQHRHGIIMDEASLRSMIPELGH